MVSLHELMRFEAAVPTILALREIRQAYLTQLQHRLEVGNVTLKRSVKFLLDKRLAAEVPYDGEVPNVKSWIVLTPLGERVADCLLEFQRKLSVMAERVDDEHRRERP